MFTWNLLNSHLEQAEPARAELVFAFTVLKREELDELVDEHWVWEMVEDDLLPLLMDKTINITDVKILSHS